MPTISIITATHAPSAHIGETRAAVLAQALPDGWDWEWLVQEDGDDPRLNGFGGDARIRYAANGAQMGIGTTRNLALARARGNLVQVLDHDDVLLPHALGTLGAVFDDQNIGWAIAQAHDLMPDGGRRGFEPLIGFGRIPAGTVNDHVGANGGNWPVHCAGLMARTALLRALGGWVAVPSDDDLAMFAAVSELADGWHHETVTWLYRQYPEQIHRHEKWKQWGMHGREVGLQRAAALRAVKLQAAAPWAASRPDVAVSEAVKPDRALDD